MMMARVSPPNPNVIGMAAAESLRAEEEAGKVGCDCGTPLKNADGETCHTKECSLVRRLHYWIDYEFERQMSMYAEACENEYDDEMDRRGEGEEDHE